MTEGSGPAPRWSGRARQPLAWDRSVPGQARSCAAADVLGAHPEVARWTVGGHSPGGVAAGRYAATGDPRVHGLLLWASYPVDDLSQRRDLAAWSISGEHDGFTTQADVADSRGLLPASTRYVQVPGAVHAHFGDYGEQPGDGVPTTSRDAAQARIVQASVEALAS